MAEKLPFKQLAEVELEMGSCVEVGRSGHWAGGGFSSEPKNPAKKLIFLKAEHKFQKLLPSFVPVS